jgi:hypothetical protein
VSGEWLAVISVGEYGRCWVLGTKDQIPTRSYGLLWTPTDPTIPNNPTEFFR